MVLSLRLKGLICSFAPTLQPNKVEYILAYLVSLGVRVYGCVPTYVHLCMCVRYLETDMDRHFFFFAKFNGLKFNEFGQLPTMDWLIRLSYCSISSKISHIVTTWCIGLKKPNHMIFSFYLDVYHNEWFWVVIWLTNLAFCEGCMSRFFYIGVRVSYLSILLKGNIQD